MDRYYLENYIYEGDYIDAFQKVYTYVNVSTGYTETMCV
jgi:hypothetical protein